MSADMPESANSRPPSPLRRVADAFLDRALRLPARTGNYSITRDVQIPMRDGVVLLADLWSPTGAAKGTLLVRSPYGWGAFVSTLSGGIFASRGYHVLLARCRGTFGSGGEFEPFLNEVEDGLDTVAWIRDQPWFSGEIGLYGGSYVGFTEWAILTDPPPDVKAAVIQVAPHDIHPECN